MSIFELQCLFRSLQIEQIYALERLMTFAVFGGSIPLAGIPRARYVG